MKNIFGKGNISKDLGMEDNRKIVWYMNIPMDSIRNIEKYCDELEEFLLSKDGINQSNMHLMAESYTDLWFEDTDQKPYLTYIFEKIIHWEVKTLIIRDCLSISDNAVEFFQFIQFLKEYNVSLESIKKPWIDLAKCDLRKSRNMNIEISEIEKIIESL